MNREAIKQCEDELLGHVQRMAVMEEAELHRMATDISLAEEKAATHGKGLNFFSEQKLHADRRKRYSKRETGSFTQDLDAKMEYEWNRALKRGGKYVIHDPKQHLFMKNKIKDRMVELASILSTQ